MHAENSITEEEKAGTYFHAAANIERIGDYEFVVHAFYPNSSSQGAIDKLCRAIKPQVLRTLAKQKHKVLVSHSQMPCETAAGRR